MTRESVNKVNKIKRTPGQISKLEKEGIQIENYLKPVRKN